MKVYFVEKFSEGDRDQQLEAMRQYMEFVPLAEADVIYCASIVMMSQARAAARQVDKPLVVYCWDYYLWAHKGRHYDGSDWAEYARFLQDADLVIVPSAGQQLRLKELLGIDSVVVCSGILTYEHEVTDGGFILDPVRYYPEENRDWAVEAAKQLGIPLIHSEHQYSQEEFRKLVASCSFMTCAYREASTGGLTLMEGLALGKVSLVSNSPYMGARSYLGDLGRYFQYDDFEDLKAKMLELWRERPTIAKVDVDAHMQAYTFDAMARGLKEAICAHVLK